MPTLFSLVSTKNTLSAVPVPPTLTSVVEGVFGYTVLPDLVHSEPPPPPVAVILT
jgi:hypothetical protein